jgi:hypothetical protein
MSSVGKRRVGRDTDAPTVNALPRVMNRYAPAVGLRSSLLRAASKEVRRTLVRDILGAINLHFPKRMPDVQGILRLR